MLETPDVCMSVGSCLYTHVLGSLLSQSQVHTPEDSKLLFTSPGPSPYWLDDWTRDCPKPWSAWGQEAGLAHCLPRA